MSYSQTYSMLAGWLEVTAGVLIFIPYTYPLGSVLSVAVMSNVFLLNMCFDVPVKLFSFHILMFSLFLASPYLLPIVKVLLNFKDIQRPKILNQRATLPLVQGFQYLILVLALWLSYKEAQNIVELKKDWARDQKHYGVWKIQSEVFDWYQIIFHQRNIMTIQSKDGRMLRLHFKEQEQGLHEVSEFVSHKDLGAWQLIKENEQISLIGSLNGEKFRLIAKKVKIREHPLLQEKFKFSQDHALLR